MEKVCLKKIYKKKTTNVADRQNDQNTCYVNR